jgi:hypothetical protein
MPALIGDAERAYRVAVRDLLQIGIEGGLMRFATALGVTVLIGSLSSTAQTEFPAKSSSALHRDAANALAPACPIDMQVRQGVGGGMLAVDRNGEKRKIFAPRLRLFLNDLRLNKPSERIVSATVTVHGSSGKARILPLDADSDRYWELNSAQLDRTLTVDLAEWGEPGVSGDFRLPGFVTTSRVDLQSVTYEDGTTWRLSRTEACHVAPDLLMRVGN